MEDEQQTPRSEECPSGGSAGITRDERLFIRALFSAAEETATEQPGGESSAPVAGG